MSQLTIYVILGLFIAINLVVGFLVLRSNPKGLVNRLFALLLLCVITWLVANAAADASVNPIDNLFWTKLTMAAAAAIPWSLVLFARVFPEKRRLQPLPFALLLLPFAAVAVLSLATNLVIAGAESIAGITQVHFGYLATLYALYFVAYSGAALTLLFTKFRRSRGVGRSQLEYLIFGFGLSILTGSLTNLILPVVFNNFALTPLGSVSTGFLLGFTAYSIITKHLFDIRIIIRRTIVYTALFTSLFFAYSVVIFIFAQALPGAHVTGNALAANFIASIVIGFSFDPLRRWLQDRTDAFLYKKEYQQQAVLKELSASLNNVVGLDEALEIVMQTIVKTLKVNHAITYVFQPAEHEKLAIKRIKQIGYPNTRNLLLQDKDFTTEYFCAHPEIAVVGELAAELQEEKAALDRHGRRSAPLPDLSARIRQAARTDATVKKLQSLEAEIAIPLHLDRQCIGLILLSGKLSGEIYDNNDMQLLELIGADAISSIQKAKLYEGDQMKSEFVSIASHELLTPVSAIEGYLSMILDEHVGKVDRQSRAYLTKVYVSAKRLSQLVKDLLSVSRIESGKMTFNPQAVDMNKLIHDTLDQLKFIAKEKNLALRYDESAASLPAVKADPDRLTQVLVNLIGNGIKYTPKGSVSLHASRQRGRLSVSVSDTGLGMSAEARAHLFEKFYRVTSDQTKTIAGTGLGLYITKQILERMDGSIKVESAPGKGSTFTISLPLFHSESSPRPR